MQVGKQQVMKTNFTAKNAKSLRTNANAEHKGMNAAIRSLATVWNRETNDKELNDSIAAAKADGLTIADFSAEFIKTHLLGTKWVSEDGTTILTNKKGQMVPKATWTAGAVVDYVRRANAAKLAKENKENK